MTDDDGDIEVHPSVAVACLELEPVDVLDGVYEAFDSRGQRLRVSTDGNVISMAVESDSSPDPAELVRRLRRFIDRVGADRVGLSDPANASLPALLDALLRFLRGR